MIKGPISDNGQEEVSLLFSLSLSPLHYDSISLYFNLLSPSQSQSVAVTLLKLIFSTIFESVLLSFFLSPSHSPFSLPFLSLSLFFLTQSLFSIALLSQSGSGCTERRAVIFQGPGQAC